MDHEPCTLDDLMGRSRIEYGQLQVIKVSLQTEMVIDTEGFTSDIQVLQQEVDVFRQTFPRRTELDDDLKFSEKVKDAPKNRQADMRKKYYRTKADRGFLGKFGINMKNHAPPLKAVEFAVGIVEMERNTFNKLLPEKSKVFWVPEVHSTKILCNTTYQLPREF